VALKHTYTVAVRNDSGTGVSDSTVIEGPLEHNIIESVPAGGSVEVDVNIDVSKIKSFYVEMDQNGRVDTNTAGTALADQYFALTAKKMLYWNELRHDDNPLTVDITKLFFFNDSSDTAATAKAGFLTEA
jgi:hypothetical protein